jgi:O-acetyl-ADP-ribose deacetylase (regulator of RNase III)
MDGVRAQRVGANRGRPVARPRLVCPGRRVTARGNGGVLLVATVVGLGVLVAGVGLYLYGTRAGSPRRYSIQVVAWLVMALAPVFLVFTYFPTSDTSGRLSGFSMGGAFAAFVLIWWLGSRRSAGLEEPDRLGEALGRERDRSAELAEELERVRADTGSRVLAEQETYSYHLAGRPDKPLVIVTGDIDRLRTAELWANSENCEMQMSRYFENTLSARIRYHGAVRDDSGYVTDDVIAGELAARMDGRMHVVPGTVLVTGAGELEKTHGVRAILHVAAVAGTPGVGYTAVPNVAECVRNVLRRADELPLNPAPTSIVCPLFGTGSGRAGIEPTARVLVSEVIRFLREGTAHIRTVYVLAFRERELEVLRQTLDTSGTVVPETTR